jgi:outer membrane protein assembly factor BamB
MKTIFLLFLSLAAAWCVSPSATIAQDFETVKQRNWHQWRGPNANGVASQGNPPVSWNDQTNIKWRFSIVGEGSSTPIVWESQVFILSAIETNRKPKNPPQLSTEANTIPPENIFEFVVWSLDRNTGDVLWKKVCAEAAPHEGHHPSTTYAAASPTTDGKYLYASFGSYGVFCLSLKGDLVWQKDLGDMRTRRGWGEAVSPVVHHGKVVIMWDQEDDSAVFVLDAATGDLVWKKDRNEPTTWATPLVVVANGKTQLITNGTNAVRSYDLDSGDLIWESLGTTLNAIPSPVQNGNQVICMGGYQGNLAFSVDLDSRGVVRPADVGPQQPIKWKFMQHTPYVPSPLVVDGRLYFTKSTDAILNCLDVVTGKPIFELTRLPELTSMYASPVAVGDRIYLTSREGTTLVIRNSPDFKVISINRLNDEIDASPAIVGDQIFLRGKRSLYCIEKPK